MHLIKHTGMFCVVLKANAICPLVIKKKSTKHYKNTNCKFKKLTSICFHLTCVTSVLHFLSFCTFSTTFNLQGWILKSRCFKFCSTVFWPGTNNLSSNLRKSENCSLLLEEKHHRDIDKLNTLNQRLSLVNQNKGPTRFMYKACKFVTTHRNDFSMQK